MAVVKYNGRRFEDWMETEIKIRRGWLVLAAILLLPLLASSVSACEKDTIDWDGLRGVLWNGMGNPDIVTIIGDSIVPNPPDTACEYMRVDTVIWHMIPDIGGVDYGSVCSNSLHFGCVSHDTTFDTTWLPRVRFTVDTVLACPDGYEEIYPGMTNMPRLFYCMQVRRPILWRDSIQCSGWNGYILPDTTLDTTWLKD